MRLMSQCIHRPSQCRRTWEVMLKFGTTPLNVSQCKIFHKGSLSTYSCSQFSVIKLSQRCIQHANRQEIVFSYVKNESLRDRFQIKINFKILNTNTQFWSRISILENLFRLKSNLVSFSAVMATLWYTKGQDKIGIMLLGADSLIIQQCRYYHALGGGAKSVRLSVHAL